MQIEPISMCFIDRQIAHLISLDMAGFRFCIAETVSIKNSQAESSSRLCRFLYCGPIEHVDEPRPQMLILDDILRTNNGGQS